MTKESAKPRREARLPEPRFAERERRKSAGRLSRTAPAMLHLLDRRLAEDAVRPEDEQHEQQREGDEVPVRGGQECDDEDLDRAQDVAAYHGAPRMLPMPPTTAEMNAFQPTMMPM